jgi:hypothetical protein
MSVRGGLAMVTTTIAASGVIGLVGLAGLASLAGCAGMEGVDLDGVLGGEAPLDEETVARGLKQALTVGTGRAAGQVGSRDGYLGDETLRILLPSELRDVASTLRRVGLGGKVDELEVAMNRAAEQAAGEATDVFADAIADLTIADAWSILRGHDTAATEYFRGRTSAALTARYRPIVETRLREVGGYDDYAALVARLESLPFVEPPELDLVGHVTEHALEGLFTVLAVEERKIREDPVARTTRLLQRVFGAG